jgi:Flp pilus assembly protein TadD
MNRLVFLVLLLAALVPAGCSRSAPPKPSAATHDSLRAQALIDSGNAAFRAKDFDAAARRYASAAAVHPDDPAAYYGLGMALSRLGRGDEAREAYTKSRELAGRAADSGAIAPPH